MIHNHLQHKVIQVSEEDITIKNMGLDKGSLEQAIKDGLIQYKRSSPLHPLTHAGSTAWGEIVYVVRAKLLSLGNGWSFYQKDGLSITHNKGTGIAIIVTSGDKDTGLSGGSPSTKNKKGPSTRNIVNNNQPSLFEPIHSENLADAESPLDSTETWVLLYCIDKIAKEIRFELSLPSSTARISGKENKLKIDSWKTRLIFEPVPFDIEPNKITSEKAVFTDEVSFKVSKKV